jgi:hypothetical protein
VARWRPDVSRSRGKMAAGCKQITWQDGGRM